MPIRLLRDKFMIGLYLFLAVVRFFRDDTEYINFILVSVWGLLKQQRDITYTTFLM